MFVLCTSSYKFVNSGKNQRNVIFPLKVIDDRQLADEFVSNWGSIRMAGKFDTSWYKLDIC